MTTLHEGDCRVVLPTLADASVDSVVTDPPYGLVEPRSNGNGSGCAFAPRTEEAKARRRSGFMGKAWDSEVPGVEFWSPVLRVLKPGGYLLAFGGTRTYHRLACAIEDAGFEIRDCLMWIYGTGFPKGQGCLKPAWEPIILARKPGSRVLPLGIDACRVPTSESTVRTQNAGPTWSGEFKGGRRLNRSDAGRYPANVLHDGSDEVLEAFAAFGEKVTNPKTKAGYAKTSGRVYGDYARDSGVTYEGSSGTAARFFYCAKASKSERGAGNTHPTVKPLALMQWLVRLVTPSGGAVLDPFAGSGTTLLAAEAEGRSAVGIEQDAGHCAIIRARLAAAAKDQGLFAEAV